MKTGTRKQQSSPRRAEVSLGKGKVTPLQIAFIVDRYLSENGFSATLASFHAEAAELFAKTRTREAPKGLLRLADILDEYVSLKEQRIVVDQEKQSVDALLQGIHVAMRAYHSAGSACSSPCPPLPSPSQSSPSLPMPPAPPTTPAAAATPVGRLVPANSSNKSPSGPMVQNIRVLRSSSRIVPNNVVQPNTLLPTTADTTCSNKRKNSKLGLKAPAAPKKHRGEAQAEVSTIEGTPETAQSAVTSSTDHVVQKLPGGNLTSAIQQNTSSSDEGPSVAEDAFSQQTDSKASSGSPKTPPQACSVQAQNMAPFLANSSNPRSAIAGTFGEMTPSKCSIISSKTVVVSPFKNSGYYAVEKSCYLSSSPLKLNPKNVGQRDRVKGRLDFDDLEMPFSSENPAVAESSTSATGDMVDDIFDLDLTDFDMDFSFGELLVNVDLGCEEFTNSFQPVINPLACSFSGPEDIYTCLDTSRDVSDPSLSSVSGIVSEKAINVTGGHDSLTCVKTITKCVKITSPAKGTRICCLETP